MVDCIAAARSVVVVVVAVVLVFISLGMFITTVSVALQKTVLSYKGAYEATRIVQLPWDVKLWVRAALMLLRVMSNKTAIACV